MVPLPCYQACFVESVLWPVAWREAAFSAFVALARGQAPPPCTPPSVWVWAAQVVAAVSLVVGVILGWLCGRFCSRVGRSVASSAVGVQVEPDVSSAGSQASGPVADPQPASARAASFTALVRAQRTTGDNGDGRTRQRSNSGDLRLLRIRRGRGAVA